MKFLFTLIAVSTALMFIGCGGDDSADSLAPKRTEPSIEVPDERPPTRVLVTDIEEGDGEEVEDGDTIIVDYVGVYYESGREFENSWTGSAFKKKFEMGSRELIEGWQQGMKGMKVGGRRELIIPAVLGFGSGSEALVYVIDLRGIE